jgi:hypothetical protein
VEARLLAVAPATVRRGSAFRLELRGSALRPDHRARVLRGRRDATGIAVVRQEVVSPTLVSVVVLVDEDAPLGSYSIALLDGDGHMTNSVGFEVIL